MCRRKDQLDPPLVKLIKDHFVFGGIMRGKQIHTPIWVAGSVLIVVLLVGSVAGGALTVRHGNAAFAAPVSVSAASEQARMGETFAPIVQTDARAIVNLSSS